MTVCIVNAVLVICVVIKKYSNECGMGKQV